MAMLTPPPRIGKTAGGRTGKAAALKKMTKRGGRKRKVKRVGLINRG